MGEDAEKSTITPTQEGVLREKNESDEAIYQERWGAMVEEHRKIDEEKLKKLKEEAGRASTPKTSDPELKTTTS